MRLSNRVALVVGAGASGPGWGNGNASAVLYAREGARVFAVDIDRAAAGHTQELIEREGGQCAAYQADVAQPDQVADAVQACLDRFGQVDVLHNNVGIVEIGGPVEIDIERWDHLIDVNVRAMFLACKHVLPSMEASGRGAIINISSLVALQYAGFPQVSYAASKGAIISMTRNIALQYAAKGIRANCILPGLMNTPLIVKPLAAAYGGDVDTMIRRRDAQCPTGRMGTAWDVAHAALFLASDEARYITGVALPVDAGTVIK